MPKVVSRAVVSTSDQAGQTTSQQTVLRTFYCLCGEFLLVIDRGLESLPRRKTDEAYIIRCKDGKDLPTQAARKFKLTATAGTRCFIKRRGEPRLEPRVPLHCSRCNTQVGYQTGPAPVGSGDFLYILKGGITENQGHIPPDAFHSEHLYALTDEESRIRQQLAQDTMLAQGKAEIDEELKRKLEKDRMNLGRGGGGTTEEKLDVGELPVFRGDDY